MAEKLERQPESDNKGQEQARELDGLRSKVEVNNEKIESEQKRAKKLESESEQKVEKLKAKLEKKSEKKEEESKKENLEKKPEPTSKNQKKLVFKREITKIQDHLTPTQRTFSKVVHNRAVENVSQVLEETVLRPSFITGGAIGATIFGGLIYLVAKIQGYPLAGTEFIFGLIAGGLVGVLVELVRKSISRSKHKDL